MNEQLIREIRMRPAYDKRNEDPSKNYGVHGAELGFYLRGEAGAVQFIIFTNWHLPHVHAEWNARGCREPRFCGYKPMPADIGYHSKMPRYEGQTMLTSECEFTGGGPCYYDGSGLNAEEGFKILVAEGHEAVWKWMENYYEQWLSPMPVDTIDG